jgi:hypothetical protein
MIETDLLNAICGIDAKVFSAIAREQIGYNANARQLLPGFSVFNLNMVAVHGE